jgi:hypothetical protein
MNNSSRKQRRQRAILSCNDCRRRKLKCDRLSPCNRCSKGGIADLCAYGLEAHTSGGSEGPQEGPRKKRRTQSSQSRQCTIEEHPVPSDSESDAFNEVGTMEPRLADQAKLSPLEHDNLGLRQQGLDEEQEPRDQGRFLAKSPDLKTTNCSTTVMGMLKGRSFGTHYYGPSSSMSVVAHVSLARVEFVSSNECLANLRLGRLKKHRRLTAVVSRVAGLRERGVQRLFSS